MLVRIWRNWNPQILQGGNVKWYSLCEQQTVIQTNKTHRIIHMYTFKRIESSTQTATNLDSVLKSRDIILPTEVCIVKVYM